MHACAPFSEFRFTLFERCEVGFVAVSSDLLAHSLVEITRSVGAKACADTPVRLPHDDGDADGAGWGRPWRFGFGHGTLLFGSYGLNLGTGIA